MNPNDNPAPLSQPTRFTCAHCGFGWNESNPFCPRCGAAQTPALKQKASAGVMVAYGCGFIVFGAVGACFSLLGVDGGSLSDKLNPVTIIGVASVALSLFLLWKLVRGGR